MQEYFYGQHIRRPHKFIILATFCIITTFITFISVAYYSIEISKRRDFLLNSIIASVFVLSILICDLILLYFISIKDIKNTKITLGNKHIIYEDKKKKINILYRNINKIEIINKKYGTSIIKVCTNKDKIIILSSLENIDTFMENLKKNLSSELSNDLNVKYNNSIFNKISSIISKKINFIIIAWTINMILVFLSSYGVYGKINSFLVAFIVYIYPFIIFFICEVILNSKINKNTWIRSNNFVCIAVTIITVIIVIILIAFIKASSTI